MIPESPSFLSCLNTVFQNPQTVDTGIIIPAVYGSHQVRKAQEININMI